jgi:hypothetical protein
MIEGLDHPVELSLVPRIAIALRDPAPVAGESLPPPE